MLHCKTISHADNPAVVEWGAPMYTVAEDNMSVDVCLTLTVDTTAGNNIAEDDLGNREVTVTVTSVNSTAISKINSIINYTYTYYSIYYDYVTSIVRSDSCETLNTL